MIKVLGAQFIYITFKTVEGKYAVIIMVVKKYSQTV